MCLLFASTSVRPYLSSHDLSFVSNVPTKTVPAVSHVTCFGRYATSGGGLIYMSHAFRPEVAGRARKPQNRVAICPTEKLVFRRRDGGLRFRGEKYALFLCRLSFLTHGMDRLGRNKIQSYSKSSPAIALAYPVFSFPGSDPPAGSGGGHGLRLETSLRPSPFSSFHEEAADEVVPPG